LSRKGRKARLLDLLGNRERELAGMAYKPHRASKSALHSGAHFRARQGNR